MSITGITSQEYHIFMISSGWNDFKLSQWRVIGNDNDFFLKLKMEYKKTRGWLRFGWLRYSHCDFFEVK